jgi:hypothetical protein
MQKPTTFNACNHNQSKSLNTEGERSNTMPFNTTTTVPDPNSPVTVKFTGLMLLKAGPNNTCEVGIHHLSEFHTFEAILVVNQPGRPLTLVRLFSGPLSAPVSIRRAPAPPAGFQVFAQEPFSRNNGSSHEFDHRWALNPRSWHPGVDFDEGANPILTLNAGILYASNLTREGLNPGLVPAPSPTSLPNPKKQRAIQPLHGFAADLAVAIDVTPPNSGLFIEWDEAGTRQTVQLPRAIDPAGTTYTISLMNEPLSTTAPAHDELSLYYNVLRANGNRVPLSRQLRIQVEDPGRSDEVPCMPVILNP